MIDELRGVLGALFFMDLCRSVALSPRSLSRLKSPEKPCTCPQDLSPTCCLLARAVRAEETEDHAFRNLKVDPGKGS